MRNFIKWFARPTAESERKVVAESERKVVVDTYRRRIGIGLIRPMEILAFSAEGDLVEVMVAVLTDSLELKFNELPANVTVVIKGAHQQQTRKFDEFGEITMLGTPRVINVWRSGYACTGSSETAKLLGTVTATSFTEAVQELYDKGNGTMRDNLSVERMTYWGCSLHEFEVIARISFG